MDNARARETEIFAEALVLPPADRSQYLVRACGSDEALRKRVEELLKVQDRVVDFMEKPNAESGFSIAAAPEEKGGRVGRYRLIEKIGEGGCGVVYRAEQDESVRREVALKIIKPGMDTKKVIARFEAERQALAMMDHPGIAKVFDAGQTDSGRPFFVMELIRGTRITDYCDRQSLPTEARLKLFVQVCQAIQHAHQKGVIHRDIKPSNILVTTSAEGVPHPVVIDFGIAKATVNVRLTDKTLFTAVDMLIGTPTYMSPEQATGSGADVDTRSDIYSLGVLLYELLTGATPFDAGELLQLGIDEVRRAIREQEPPQPSARLGKMTGETLAGVAKQRKAEPLTLIRSVRGDLDWIVMRALEKDRARRYATASGFAEDVKRYLSDETVSARPASVGYRLQKTLLRHKLLFAAAGAAAVFLVISLVMISTALAKERRARREADVARQQAEADKQKAETEAGKSRQVTVFLEDVLQGVGPTVALGRDTRMLREILDRTVMRLETELLDQPAVVAHLRNRLGGVYYEISAFEQAAAMHQAALAEYRKLSLRDTLEVAESLYLLGKALLKERKPLEARPVLEDAVRIYTQVHGRAHIEVAQAIALFAVTFMLDGHDAKAESLCQEALAIQRTLPDADPLLIAHTLTTLGVTLVNQEKFAAAESVQREVLRIRRERLPPNHPNVASALGNLCWTLSQSANPDLAEMESLMREAVAMRRNLFGSENREVADSLMLLTAVLRRLDKLAEAEAAIDEAIAIRSKLNGYDHIQTVAAREDRGKLLVSQGRLTEAETVLRDSLAKRREIQGNDHQRVGLHLANLGNALARQKKLPEAESCYRQSVVILKKHMGPDSPVVASALAELAGIMYQRRQYAEAEVLLREAAAIEHRAFPEGDRQRVRSLEKLPAVLEAQGKRAELDAIRAELDAAKGISLPAKTL